MFARIARFENDPANVDAAVARIRENIDSGLPTMPGLTGARFLLLADRGSGTMLGVALFDTEDAMRAGDAAMNSGPGAAGSRSSVEFYEVAVDTQV
jgi:hypothetical protein